MPNYVRVASVGDIPRGTMKGIRVGSVEVLLANLAGDFLALEDVCTHAQCNLSEGEIEDDNVICPCHGGEFNLRTGVVEVGPPDQNLEVYHVRVNGDDVEVGFP